VTKLHSWCVDMELSLPSLEDNTADWDRIQVALKNRFDVSRSIGHISLYRSLPSIVREAEYKVRCSLFRDRASYYITGVAPASQSSFLGVAVDLGTTRYVVEIVDLVSRASIVQGNYANPQGKIGPDILSRIHHASTQEGLEELRTLIIEDLNCRITQLCEKEGLEKKNIVNVAVAGNTAMTHLFLGIEPRWIIREPYIPPLNKLDLMLARDIGLDVAPGARLFMFPNVGSYFGGDLFAGILYCGMHLQEEISLFVDVGTNAEVVLGNKDWLIACAGAAGPALEGGVSKIGKQASPGVIDRVKFDPEKGSFVWSTIGGLPPVGICGSGIIDLAAELFRNGLLDFRGKFVVSRAPELFVERDGIIHLILVRAEESGTGKDLLISQPEIDSLIRSKAAMFTILETLAETVGVSLSEISRFYVGGTFGNFIDPRSAITIGMLPDLSLDKFVPLGNSSLKGAREFLCRPALFEELLDVERKITYIELNVNQEFMNKFSAAKFLPHTDRSKFPSLSSLTF